jgi:hypothetical protein
MAHINTLYDAILRNDPVNFLTDYLSLVVRGTSLTLPQSLEFAIVKMQWKECMPKKCEGVSDIFLEDLSHIWIKTVQQQGAKLRETFPQELLEIMMTRTVENTPLPSHDSESADVNEIRQVTSSISSSYVKDKKARKIRFLSAPESIKRARDSLEKLDADMFILSLLQLAIRTDKPLVPLSNDYHKISEKWAFIISKVLKIRIDSRMLEKLTGRWLNITTKKGIPKSKKELIEIVYHIRATREKPERINPSMFSKYKFVNFISKFFT